MANPQIEHGHVKIASELIEALARVNLRPYEWRALLFVIRKTYGWKKKLDFISVSQIAEGTGLYKQHASRARLTLLRKHILVENAGRIGVNKDYDQWQIDSKIVTGTGDEKVTDLGEKVTGTGYKPSPKQAPQKNIKHSTKAKRKKHTQKSKPRKSRKFIPPTVAEVRAYAENRGYPNFNAEKFIEYYAEADWHDSKDNPVRNWKQKMLAVWLKDKDKPENVADILGCGPVDEEDARRALRQAGLWKDET